MQKLNLCTFFLFVRLPVLRSLCVAGLIFGHNALGMYSEKRKDITKKCMVKNFCWGKVFPFIKKQKTMLALRKTCKKVNYDLKLYYEENNKAIKLKTVGEKKAYYLKDEVGIEDFIEFFKKNVGIDLPVAIKLSLIEDDHEVLKKFFEVLPKNCNSLTICYCNSLTDEDLENLPEKLKILKLKDIDDDITGKFLRKNKVKIENFQCDTSFKPKFLIYLSKYLKTLKFSSYQEADLWPKELQKLENLENLCISFSDIKDFFWLQSLKNLKKLCVNEKFKEEHIKLLSKNLLSLNLRAIRGEFSKNIGKNFKYLPRGLESLKLISLEKIEKEDFNSLPATLRKIYIYCNAASCVYDFAHKEKIRFLRECKGIKVLNKHGENYPDEIELTYYSCSDSHRDCPGN